jgi:hypothetical protein
MSETEDTILRQTQAMLDDTLEMLDEQMARILRSSGPDRVLAAEHWFRGEIRKALVPLIARIVQLESRPLPPTATALNPSQLWEKTMLQTVGKFVASEIDKRAIKRIEQLEKEIEQRRYVGVWAVGTYHEGNLVTHDGSMWHCNQETTQRPGSGPDWTLAIKRGRDGVDANRRPTMQRGYGS